MRFASLKSILFCLLCLMPGMQGRANVWDSASFSATTTFGAERVALRVEQAKWRLTSITIETGATTIEVPANQLADVEHPDFRTIHIRPLAGTDGGGYRVSLDANLVPRAMPAPKLGEPHPNRKPAFSSPEVISYFFANGQFLRRERHPCVPSEIRPGFIPQPEVEYIVTGRMLWVDTSATIGPKSLDVSRARNAASEFVYRTALANHYALPPQGGGSLTNVPRWTREESGGGQKIEFSWSQPEPSGSQGDESHAENYCFKFGDKNGGPPLNVIVRMPRNDSPTAKVVMEDLFPSKPGQQSSAPTRYPQPPDTRIPAVPVLPEPIRP